MIHKKWMQQITKRRKPMIFRREIFVPRELKHTQWFKHKNNYKKNWYVITVFMTKKKKQWTFFSLFLWNFVKIFYNAKALSMFCIFIHFATLHITQNFWSVTKITIFNWNYIYKMKKKIEKREQKLYLPFIIFVYKIFFFSIGFSIERALYLHLHVEK